MIIKIIASFIALFVLDIGWDIGVSEIGVFRFVVPWAIAVVILEAGFRYEAGTLKNRNDATTNNEL